MFTDLFSLILNRNLSKRKIQFAFIVHPRNTQDIYRKYSFLKVLPKRVVDFILLFFWPTYGGRIKVQDPVTGLNHWGAIIICPLTAKQMLGKRSLAAKKVYRASKLAAIYGAKIVGLGALTSVVTDGGDYVKEKLPDIAITSGNSLTSFIASDDVMHIVSKQGLTGPIAVIGATGSIGKAVSKILASKNGNKLILVGKNPERIELLKQTILTTGLRDDESSIHATTNIQDVAHAEVLVVVTSAEGAVIHEDFLSKTKVIYDLTQPKNTPKHIQDKEDLLFVDGGLIQLPEYIDIGLDISLPKGVAFACLSETILLSMSGKYELVSRGELRVDYIEQVGELKHNANFKSLIRNNV